MSTVYQTALREWSRYASACVAYSYDPQKILSDCSDKVFSSTRRAVDVPKWFMAANVSDVSVVLMSLVDSPDCARLITTCTAMDDCAFLEVRQRLWTSASIKRVSTEPPEVKRLYAVLVLSCLAPPAALAMLPACSGLSDAHGISPAHPDVILRVLAAALVGAIPDFVAASQLPVNILEAEFEATPLRWHARYWNDSGASTLLDYFESRFMLDAIVPRFQDTTSSFSASENEAASAELSRLHHEACAAISNMFHILYHRKAAHDMKHRAASGTGEAFRIIEKKPTVS